MVQDSQVRYVLYRQLMDLGVHCVVAAPSHLPKIPGDHRKTDRLDAQRLASFLRAGQIVAVSPPSPGIEALRTLTHTRDATLDFLVDELERRVGALAQLDLRIEERAQASDVAESVKSLMAFRGVRVLTAMCVIAELADPRRFKSARQVGSYCGLVPSEHSSGSRVHRGPITRAGNAKLRRLLVEATQHFARPFPDRSAPLPHVGLTQAHQPRQDGRCARADRLPVGRAPSRRHLTTRREPGGIRATHALEDPRPRCVGGMTADDLRLKASRRTKHPAATNPRISA